jgi:hypothetical protein
VLTQVVIEGGCYLSSWTQTMLVVLINMRIPAVY